jgi:hypothetical protein
VNERKEKGREEGKKTKERRGSEEGERKKRKENETKKRWKHSSLVLPFGPIQYGYSVIE